MSKDQPQAVPAVSKPHRVFDQELMGKLMRITGQDYTTVRLHMIRNTKPKNAVLRVKWDTVMLAHRKQDGGAV